MKSSVAAMRATAGIEVVRTSSVYETQPVGDPEQPLFLNAVAQLRTDLSPRDLLDRFKAIEVEVGRTPGERWGPREIDIDLLLYDDEVVDTGDLQVPHPEMTARSFVLVPLLEIDRSVTIPGTGPGAGEARMHDMMLGRAGVRLAHPPHFL